MLKCLALNLNGCIFVLSITTNNLFFNHTKSNIMKFFVKKSNYNFGGWGNGYVVIPEGHVLHGLHYEQIQSLVGVSVYGGLTFSESACNLNWEECDAKGWVVGFDTAYSKVHHDKLSVLREATDLLLQLALFDMQPQQDSDC